ncbi:MAG TPA: T9SS type A sorting domain-containing protein [Chitinophagaceae bacterium]|nr:T9SS type A sorting domain-containing protein [Chitinophagaceae bacterium]
MAKDITSGSGASQLHDLCSARGKLYFLNGGADPNSLWSSDRTGDKLFFGGRSYQYGTELYEGDASAKTLNASIVSSPNRLEAETNAVFDVLVYPNPSHGMATLQIKGEVKDLGISITDITGKLIWQNNYHSQAQINLPTNRLTPGAYLIMVKSDLGNKNITYRDFTSYIYRTQAAPEKCWTLFCRCLEPKSHLQ